MVELIQTRVQWTSDIWMSEIQQTESEFTFHPFLIQEFEPEQLLPFPPNLLLKIFREVTKIIVKDNCRETCQLCWQVLVSAMVKFYYSAAA